MLKSSFAFAYSARLQERRDPSASVVKALMISAVLALAVLTSSVQPVSAVGIIPVNQPYEFGPPYAFGFEPTDDFRGVAILDENHDGITWGVTTLYALDGVQAGAYTGTTSRAADDWIVSIGFKFHAGALYRAFFHYRVDSASNPQKLELRLGNAQTAIAMTQSLLNLGTITNTTFQRGDVSFTVPTSGVYYFGLHAT
ncbi:MAG TPA: hypothetical protein VE222_13680, partial [Nitrospiraceae bacterium]|nr:hypothetical protein [Nitrospiraceae bacterium]